MNRLTVSALLPMGTLARRFLSPWLHAAESPCALQAPVPTPVAHPLPDHAAPATGDLPTPDWDLLFRAVVDRLAATVEANRGAGAGQPPGETSARLRDVLLDCADALDHLRAAADDAAGAAGTSTSTARQR